MGCHEIFFKKLLTLKTVSDGIRSLQDLSTFQLHYIELLCTSVFL